MRLTNPQSHYSELDSDIEQDYNVFVDARPKSGTPGVKAGTRATSYPGSQIRPRHDIRGRRLFVSTPLKISRLGHRGSRRGS